MPSAAVLRAHIESSLGERLSSTLLLRERAAPVTVSTRVAGLDELTGGLPRGALTEIAGAASSGRTGVMLAALAGATQRQEFCALVDASDSFDPFSAAVAGVNLDRLLWVRCSEQAGSAKTKYEGIRYASAASKTKGTRGHELGFSTKSGFAFGGVLEQVLKVTDLLLQGSGFGMVVLDMGDVPVESVRRVPLTSWFRFRRAVEPTSTVLLLVEQEACAKTCASLVVRLEREAVCAHDSAPIKQSEAPRWPAMTSERVAIPVNNAVSHGTLLGGMRVRAEVVRSWSQRKPVQGVGARLEARATW